jgi:phage FluMu protein Com
MRSPIRRRAFFSALSLVGSSLAVFAAKPATASEKKTYKYRCPKCKLVQEYTVPGVKKCPNDGTTMIRMSS